MRSVDVSSRLTATVSASTGHTLMSCRSAAATMSMRPTRASRRTVSKNSSDCSGARRPRNPAARAAAREWHPRRDGDEARRPVVLRVERRNHGEQHLRGADVARGALAADVLLTGLQRQPVRRLAVGVDADPDEPARQRALQSLAYRHEAGVRAAEADRHAEALRRSHGHVGAPLTRWHEQRQREQVGRGDDERAGVVRAGDEGTQVAYRSRGRRIAHQHAERRRPRAGGAVTSNGTSSIPSGSARVCSTASVCGWVSASTRNRGDADEPARRHSAIASAAAVASSSRLAPATARPVRSVTTVWNPSSASSRPWLISGWYGRVRRVPPGVLEDAAPDDRRGVRAVVAEPDQRGHDPVAARAGRELGGDLGLGHRAR